MFKLYITFMLKFVKKQEFYYAVVTNIIKTNLFSDFYFIMYSGAARGVFSWGCCTYKIIVYPLPEKPTQQNVNSMNNKFEKNGCEVLFYFYFF